MRSSLALRVVPILFMFFLFLLFRSCSCSCSCSSSSSSFARIYRSVSLSSHRISFPLFTCCFDPFLVLLLPPPSPVSIDPSLFSVVPDLFSSLYVLFRSCSCSCSSRFDCIYLSVSLLCRTGSIRLFLLAIPIFRIRHMSIN